MDGETFAMEEEALKRFMPSSFGKQSRAANVEAQINKSRRNVGSDDNHSAVAVKRDGDKRLSDVNKKDDQSADFKNADGVEVDDDDEDDDDDDDDEDEFPVSHELIIKTHERAVTTTTLDPSGARLITGSTDCTLKLHDFASMTPTTVRAFRSVNPITSKTSTTGETYPILQVAFNPISPSHFLTIMALPQARVFNRDGDLLGESIKGDMYLRDMHNTKGHVSQITSAAWHPTVHNRFVTAGTDSTLRIWDINNLRSQKEIIVHKSKVPGLAGRTRITAVAWSAASHGGGSLLAAHALDGSLLLWPGNGPFHRPMAMIDDAHARDTWTGGIDISPDGRTVVTRGGDDTIKTWDTRKFKAPITVIPHPSTSAQYPNSTIRFSPSGANIITGSPTGHLHILNPATLKAELVTPVTPGSALTDVLWHEKLNQILTASANGETHVLYSPDLSSGGAKLVMSKTPKRRHIDDDPNLTMDLSQGLSGDSIITPGGILSSTNQAASSYAVRHPTIGLTVSGKSRDPRRPHIPAVTPFAKSQPDAKHIKEHIPLSSMRDEDPREALLKYADKTEKDRIFTNAWTATQPKTIYANVSDGEDEERSSKKQRQ